LWNVTATRTVAAGTDRFDTTSVHGPEHAPVGSLDPPRPPDAARLPSIHVDERRYER